MDRRKFISLTTMFPLLGFKGLLDSLSATSSNFSFKQNLKKDPKHIIDIHPSLKYNLISTVGSKMSDGYKVPALADGMGSFFIDDNIILIRNHELVPKDGMDNGPFHQPSMQIQKLGNKHYDKDCIGGTTTIVLNKDSKKVINEYLSLSGTRNNCAGGVTPWGTWLSCEEDISKKRKGKTPHGYVFEVDPKIKGLTKPNPIKAMGRFNHEAVAFDQFSNAYLTEDRKNGLIYKFVAQNKKNLNKGDLFALQIQGVSDSRNWKKNKIHKNIKYAVNWIKIDDNDPEKDTMRYEGINNGATPFARPEGIIADGNSIYICCTSGGRLKKGQIWKLTIDSKDNPMIELWYEVRDKNSLNMPDNLTISPWGDLIVCEDNPDLNRLWGINSSGNPYLIAENNYSGSEFAGVCFSPIDNTMFVNLQGNGMTLSISGNWENLII